MTNSLNNFEVQDLRRSLTLREIRGAPVAWNTRMDGAVSKPVFVGSTRAGDIVFEFPLEGAGINYYLGISTDIKSLQRGIYSGNILDETIPEPIRTILVSEIESLEAAIASVASTPKRNPYQEPDFR